MPRTRLILIIIAIILGLYLSLFTASRINGTVSRSNRLTRYRPNAESHLLSMAHQGGNLEAPDATLAAFENGLKAGADILELDIYPTADGQLAVLHDGTIDRTTDGKGRIADYTMEELKSFDAAYWWPYHSNDDVEKKNVPADQRFPWRGQGLKILSLNELIDEFPGVPLNIEIKSPDVRTAALLAETLNATGYVENVLVVSSQDEVLEEFRKISPTTPTGANRGEVTLFWMLSQIGLEGLAPVKADALQVPRTQGRLKIITPAFIRRAHRTGLAVHAWTINDTDGMDRMIALGVDGIITDKPTLLTERLERVEQ